MKREGGKHNVRRRKRETKKMEDAAAIKDEDNERAKRGEEWKK